VPDKIREAAADLLETYGDTGRWVVAAVLMGAAAAILLRALLAP
jgi:hypothetical protein